MNSAKELRVGHSLLRSVNEENFSDTLYTHIMHYVKNKNNICNYKKIKKAVKKMIKQRKKKWFIMPNKNKLFYVSPLFPTSYFIFEEIGDIEDCADAFKQAIYIYLINCSNYYISRDLLLEKCKLSFRLPTPKNKKFSFTFVCDYGDDDERDELTIE